MVTNMQPTRVYHLQGPLRSAVFDEVLLAEPVKDTMPLEKMLGSLYRTFRRSLRDGAW